MRIALSRCSTEARQRAVGAHRGEQAQHEAQERAVGGVGSPGVHSARRQRARSPPPVQLQPLRPGPATYRKSTTSHWRREKNS